MSDIKEDIKINECIDKTNKTFKRMMICLKRISKNWFFKNFEEKMN